MATHSRTLAWKIPWTEEPGRLQSMRLLESDTTERLHFHFSLSCIGEGNGNPLQCSCLENPRDGRAWWAAVDGVAQSRTQLKRLSSSSSSSDIWYGTPFCILICHLCIFFDEVSGKVSAFFYVGCLFPYHWVLRILCITVLDQMCLLQIFSPSL